MRLTRRHFIAGGTVATTALALGAHCHAAPERPLGIQLFTVRDLFVADAVGTLQKIADIGYCEVEFGGGGYEAMDHALLRRTMDKAGLTSPSIHVGYDLLLNKFDDSLAMAKTLGADTIVLPFMTPEHHGAPEWQEALLNFNRFAEKLRKHDLGFAYHNHDFEFTVKPDGVSLWDRMIRTCDPDLVNFELDLFWAIRAEQDVNALIQGLPGRFYAYHVKDIAEDGWMAAVGTGSIDFKKIFTLNDIAGVRHFYVENDRAPAPYLPDIITSYRNLRQLFLHEHS